MSTTRTNRPGDAPMMAKTVEVPPTVFKVCCLWVLWFPSCATWAAAPVLYSQPAYESPVRGDPDDLLLLAGYGLAANDTVVYEAVSDTTRLPPHPAAIPTSSTATRGVADIVSAANAPYSLTVHLNSAMVAGQSYALWTINSNGEWSGQGLLINDARPLWITPDSAYVTESLASLPRVLKVVGRNLQPATDNTAGTQVRLVGKETGAKYVLTANNAVNDPVNTTPALERYVAVARLPSPMTVDTYSVQVRRDGRSWVPLLGNGQGSVQSFAVYADPATPPSLSVSDPRFADPGTGPCQPNDGVDDTGCILRALSAAGALPGGATVSLGPGVWTLSNAGIFQSGLSYTNRLGPPGFCTRDPPDDCGVSQDGIVLPVGVNLQGAGPEGTNATVIERMTTWPSAMPSFVVQGHNRVSGIKFVDDNNYASGAAGAAMLQLGVIWYRAHLLSSRDPTSLSNVTIDQNVFDKPYIAIGSGALPADHIYITANIFGGAWSTAIFLGQDPNEVRNLSAVSPYPVFPYQTYHYSDAITDYNTFYPSSYAYKGYAGPGNSYDGSGSIATQINTGLRTDFSRNTADGTSVRYLYSPGSDPKGWRAAHFWTTGANQEMTLVSSNTITCPGDKLGGGEAIAFDGNLNMGGTPAAEAVIAAAPTVSPHGVRGTTVTFQGPLVTVFQANPTADITSNPTPYYRGMWLQIVKGTGMGQWRKIESASIARHALGSTATVSVTPAFDVMPDVTSQVMIEHAYWQNATVSNTVDQRAPACTKGNIFGVGGSITWYDSAADSAMEGNQQFDTNGIYLNNDYKPTQTSPVTPGYAQLESANDVRYNLVIGNYNWSNPRSDASGIQLGYGACVGMACGCRNGSHSCPTPIPPNLGVGVSVAWNRIVQADTLQINNGGPNQYTPVGAIGLGPNWSTGPVDSAGLTQWELGEANLVFHNTVEKASHTLSGSIPGLARIGIGIDTMRTSALNPPTSAITWNTVVYANSCSTVDVPMRDFGRGTTRYCPSGAISGSCECSGFQPIDVGVTASSSSAALGLDEAVTYVATVTNNHPSLAANGVALSLAPSAGIKITTMVVESGSGSCDPSTDICALGTLAPGQSVQVTVTGTAANVGTWSTTFSATHQDPDPVVGNNGITLHTVVGPLVRHSTDIRQPPNSQRAE